MTLSSVPYCASHFAAVFGPTFGTPGMLSIGIAGQREEVEHLVGAHAELREHAGVVERLVAHRVDAS